MCVCVRACICVYVRDKIRWAQKGFGLDQSPQRLIYKSEFLNQQLNLKQ